MRINSQHNGFINDIFTFTTNLVCQEIDCLFNFSEVGKLLVWHFFELSPWLNFLSDVIKSELKWSSCYDTITSWQEIKTNDGFENR